MHLSKISFLKSFLAIAFIISFMSFFVHKEAKAELIYNGQFPGVQVSTGGTEGEPCSNREGDNTYDAASMEDCGGGGGGSFDPSEPDEPIVVTQGVSDSVTVHVVPRGENPETETKGTITAEKDSCIIDDGKNTCDVSFTWKVTNPDPEKVATVKRVPVAGPIINQNSGSQILPVHYWLDSIYNTNRYILSIDKVYTKIVDGVRISENGKVLGQAFVKATCKDDSSWASSLNQCVKNSRVKKFSTSNCTIPVGGSSCNSEISWEVIGGYGDFSVTTPTNITVATGKSGTKSYAVQSPSRDFYLYNNGKELATSRSYADCVGGSAWSSTENKCVYSNLDKTPRIAIQAEYAHQHTKDGVWTTDPDGSAFAVVAPSLNTEEYRVSICKKYYGNSIKSSPEYKLETITTWMGRWNVGGPYTTVDHQTYKCSTDKIITEPGEKCTNGATNYPNCNICAANSTFNTTLNKCVCNNSADNSPECTTKDDICLNGATNPPTCTIPPLLVCTNGATNYPKCDTCSANSTLNTTTNKCICNNGASDSPTCSTCAAGTTFNSSSNKCECNNGAANPPTCDPDFLKFEAKDCVILDGGNSCQTNLNWSTKAVGSFAITTPENVTVSSALQSMATPYIVEYPFRKFFAYNNGNLLAEKVAYAKCGEGSIWNEAERKCVSSLLCAGETERIVEQDCPEGQSGHIKVRQTVTYPGCEFPTPVTEFNSVYVSDNCRPVIRDCGPETCDPCTEPGEQVLCTQKCGADTITRPTNCPMDFGHQLNIDFKISNNKILKGKPVTLTWTSDAEKCDPDSSQGFFVTGGSPSGTRGDLRPVEDTTYRIICEKENITESAEVTVKVNTISIIES